MFFFCNNSVGVPEVEKDGWKNFKNKYNLYATITKTNNTKNYKKKFVYIYLFCRYTKIIITIRTIVKKILHKIRKLKRKNNSIISKIDLQKYKKRTTKS